ncbi:sugar phosphate nucleotidyltransferase [Candidatus Pelagibacter bacterium nBUS_36]|jgi:MurNAc alpha-1-phosphate uridylyltransferase|uniref:sugar phosphate nucleotidyltransferase n=1 Tax=Candidatus Pelagibacter bacterium nBUS_36 TaxID=3374194 RepID=UPI003EB7E22B
MKVNTALILCAGFGKRLNPITLDTPKPLLKLNNITVLEKCINLIESLGVRKILINTFYLREQISHFIKENTFKSKIKVIDDGKNILDTGGGILNMISHSDENDFFVFNPDTLWQAEYSNEIVEMEKLYSSKNLTNILLLANKELSFDKGLKADFNLEKNFILKNSKKNYIYTGCQILNKKILANYKVENFSITNVWNELIDKKKLFGFESQKHFYHLTNLQIFKKLKDL